MKRAVLLGIFTVLTFNTVMNPIPVFSQETSPEVEALPEVLPEVLPEALPETLPEALPEPVDENKIVYYIRTINFDITGRTRTFAIINTIDLHEGEQLTGKSALETYIRRKTQRLRNERVFKEDQCRIDYTFGEAGADDPVPVDLLVHVVDTWNFIILPEPKFDSNTGASVTAKIRDYNFMGTMNPLAIDLGWELVDDKNSFFMDIDSGTPFKFLGYTWNFNFDNNFRWSQEDPFQYKNTTGISLDLPWKKTTFTFGLEQGFSLYETTSDREKLKNGTTDDFFPDTWYLSSGTYIQWKIPLGIEVGDFGELAYTPKISESVNYRPGGDIGEYRRGPVTTFTHEIGFGQVNWKGNFRDGLDVNLQNTNNFNNYSLGFDSDIQFTAIGHLALKPKFGISSRIQYRHYFNDTNIEAGDVLRGVKNNSLNAEYMLSINLEFPMLMLRFLPSEFFGTNKLRAFNLDLHFSPFIDIAMLKGTKPDNTAYTFKDIITTAGFELIVYPHSWRSFFIRGSIGFNMREWLTIHHPPGGNNREIFIGVGHYF